MADLRVKGDYVGPGEQKTAEYLAAHLPDDWVIFAGRKLPGPNRDDVDLMIVGKSLIFVIEEKSWGPTVVVDDNYWYVKNEARPNPLNRVAQLARIVAGTLRDKAKGYKSLGRPHRVLSGVVLSHPSLQILRGRNHDDRERIWSLEEAPASLRALDDEFQGASLGVARPAVTAYLDDLPKPVGRPTMGGYLLESRLVGAGLEQSWLAQDSAGQTVILKCYPSALLSAEGDPAEFMRREYLAVNRVADLGRTWRSHPPFQDDSGSFYVVPVVPPLGGTTLYGSVRDQVPVRQDGRLDDELARAIVIDAFSALQDLHDAGLVHRALHPSRVWLHQKRRVMFSDLNLARIEGAVSIALWARDGDVSEDYRAPECAASLTLATSGSDVFSLAMCVAYWLLGEDVIELTHESIADHLRKAYPWVEPLVDALSPSQSERPTAREVVDALRPPAATPDPSPEMTSVGLFAEGSVIANRYVIDRKLGRGGFATSWKVYDRQRELTLVLKQFHLDVPDGVKAEFQAAHGLHHDYCGSVYDISITDAPHYLVSEYVEGANLAEEGTAYSVSQLRSIAICVLKALDYIHRHDLVHGDVTPSNVIASPDGSSAKLIDFGLMVRSGDRLLGSTPKFAAPEVAAGKPASISSDLFGFSATMAYAMLGRSIVAPGADGSVVTAPTRAEEDAWDVEGKHLLRALVRAAREDPTQRPASAREMLDLVRSTYEPPAPPHPGEDEEFLVNPYVGAIRRLYRASSAGNAGNRGLDDDFSLRTYVPTKLDGRLLPRVLDGGVDVVLLSGNPGDGKTSLLVQLGATLKERGAEILHQDDAGWRLRLDGRTFHSVFDASEAHGDLDSDQLVTQALEPVRTQRDGPATALIAVNDGRLRQFFDDAGAEYEDWWFEIEDQLEGHDPGDSRIVLVDLKRRSLAAFDTSGLASEVLASLTADELWATCNSCAARTGCPILANRDSLNGPARKAFAELTLISHLRRRRRATFRDVRSAAAWLITGDRDCVDAHELVSAGRNAGLMSDALAHDLAFAPESNDYLVDEWKELDPALVPDPRVDHLRRASSAREGTSYLKSAESAARAIYFGEHVPEGMAAEDVRAYRYLEKFIEMLKGRDLDDTRELILRGISRLVGAHGYVRDGLAFGVGSTDSAWAILHTIPADSFSVHTVDAHHTYLETIPDSLVLEHEGGATLTLTLDTAEMILRAGDGEVVNDPASDAIRQEIDAFVGQLSRQPSASARIVDSSGSVTSARVDGVDIVFALDGQEI